MRLLRRRHCNPSLPDALSRHPHPPPVSKIWGHCLWKTAGAAALSPEVMAELGEKPFTSSANIIEGRAVGADICADHGGRLVNSAEQSGRVLLDRSYSADAALDLLVIPANSKSPQLCRHADQDVKCAEFVGNIKDNIRVRKGGYVLNVNGMPGAAAGGSGIARFARVCLCAPRHPSPLLSSRPCSCFLSLSAAGVWTGVEGQGAKLLKVTAVRTGEDGRTYADSLESLPLTPHWMTSEAAALVNEAPWCVTSAVVDLPPLQ